MLTLIILVGIEFDSNFYFFRWEELGQYDLPNSIDYILRVTGQEKVSYVGYSLGCAIFYVAANLRPELNDKIEVMIGLAPTSTVQVLDNAFKLVAPLSNLLKVIQHEILFFLNLNESMRMCNR